MDGCRSIGGKSQRREQQKRRSAVTRKNEKKEDAGARITGRSTSRLAKAAGAELSGQIRDEKLHAVVVVAVVVVARSTFTSQNLQSTPGPDQFWKLN